jgi:hypothetical protein
MTLPRRYLVSPRCVPVLGGNAAQFLKHAPEEVVMSHLGDAPVLPW